jgi:hypothetical protein
LVCNREKELECDLINDPSKFGDSKILRD